jgi:hypothetical protein
MSDLVVRLRLNASNRDLDRGLRADNREAADRIEALEREVKTARKTALEDAARACERYANTGQSKAAKIHAAFDCAAAIRALEATDGRA